MLYNTVMSRMEKAAWSTEGDNIRFAVPLTKVDTERRLVSGFASLDNIDQHGDVVTAEASKRAFDRTKAGLREMHEKMAVGKIVDFKEDTYYDTEDEKFYQGIYVTAYVSKGAQNTWEKVLDGTLKGFSIGGNIKEAEEEWSKDAGRAIRFIKDYDLTELSLVDNPANQFANILAIQKTVDGPDEVTGMATEIKTENVFYCETDGLAKAGEDDKLDCTVCGEGMENIGWFEHDGSNTSELIAGAVKKHLQKHAEGGVIVAEETGTVEKAADEQEAVVVEEAPTEVVKDDAASEEVETEATEKAAEVDETGEEHDLVKVIGNFREAVEEQLEKTQQQVEKAVSDLDTKFAEFSEGFEKKFEELSKNHGDLTQKFADLKDELGTLEKSIDTIDSSTAVKKSGDLGGSTEETLEKSKDSDKGFWGGSFLGE